MMFNISPLALLAIYPFIQGGAAQLENCGSACALYTLNFTDEFDGTSVDTSVWNFRTDVDALSVQTPNNVAVSGGYANILLKKLTSPVSGKSYTGGGLISKPSFQYGYYETRMQVNHGSGWHNSFWMMPGDGSGPNKNGATNWTEIDVFEIDSGAPKTRRSNVFGWWTTAPNGSKSLSSGNLQGTGNFSSSYNVFGTLWNETTISTYINNTLFWSTPYSPTSWGHAYLNIWATTIGYTAPIDDNALPSSNSWDYVRYYQKDYYLTAGSLCGHLACRSNSSYSETGSWSQSGLDGYTLGLKSRYTCSTTAGSTASWNKKVPVAGGYQISAWIVSPSNSDPNAVYTVTQNGKVIQTQTVNQNNGGTNSNPKNTGIWVTLVADAIISEGDVIAVTVKGSGSGCTRSDTVKLIRTS